MAVMAEKKTRKGLNMREAHQKIIMAEKGYNHMGRLTFKDVEKIIMAEKYKGITM